MISTLTFYVWILAFISVFVSLFWVIVNSVANQYKKSNPHVKVFPKVTVVIPTWNEEKAIVSTIKCILGLDYPRDKIEIIIVDDKSKDNTVEVVNEFIFKTRVKNVRLIEHEKNKGKAGAVNTALKEARGEFFWVYDADSYASKELLKKVGGFDEGNLTEDFEIAMRLRSRGYRVVMCEKGVFYTRIPNTVKKMWMQRVRWFRGFIYNNLMYRKMILNKQFGLLGLFQIPLEVFVLITVFVSVVIMGINFVKEAVNLAARVFLARSTLFEISSGSTGQFFLGLNWNFIFPFVVVLVTAFYLYVQAHRYVGEKWKFYLPSLLYLFVYPFFRSMQWVHAALLEIFGAKRKW